LRNYETVFILDPAIGDDRTAEEVERAKSAIESAKGEVVDIQRWGKRKLAYEIKKKREGVYTVLKYRADGSAVTELERNLRLSEPVIRFLTVAEEAPTEEAKESSPGEAEAAEPRTAPVGGGEAGALDREEPERAAADSTGEDSGPDGPREERSSGHPAGEVAQSEGEASEDEGPSSEDPSKPEPGGAT
jgi:small subunit ribosomal protein S6